MRKRLFKYFARRKGITLRQDECMDSSYIGIGIKKQVMYNTKARAERHARNRTRDNTTSKRYYETHKEKEAMAAAAYYRNNKDRIQVRERKYRLTHRGQIASRMRRYNKIHKDEIRIRHAKYYLAHKAQYREREHAYHQKNKALVIERLGGKCVYCGESRLGFLTTGHKNNDGAEHRKDLLKHQHIRNFFRYLVVKNFPLKDMERLQIECWNHNMSKRRRAWTIGMLTSAQKCQLKNFKKCISYYGGACSCCGETNPLFLTLGHKNNDGNEHRKSLGYSGNGVYTYLVKNNFDVPYEMQLECWNCNGGKSVNHGICPHIELG